MVAADDNVFDFQPYVIRILNGPLRGCEYPLQAGKMVFIVGKDSVMIEHDFFPTLPDNTIYVPLEQDGINFEITTENNAPEDKQLLLHEFRGNGFHARYVDCNMPVRVGGLDIAIRHYDQEWSASVLSYPETGDREKKRHRGYPVLIMLVLAVIISGVTWSLNTPQYKTTELNALLGDERHRFNILSGRNHLYYIIAQNEQDRLWAHQVVIREGYGDSVLVTDTEEENKRVAKWFDSHYPMLAYYRLHLDIPEVPRLWISRQRTVLEASGHEVLTEDLMALLPYARSVDIVPVSDETALSQAEEGLRHRKIPFYRKNSEGELTFIISGELSDTEIYRAREFIKQYIQKWGERYIQFGIELENDKNKGRSFRYGKDMYVKTAPYEWSFIDPQ